MFDNIKGIILDLDGTLIDSGYVWHRVDEMFFAQRGMDIPEDYVKKINSMSFYETAEFTKKEYNIRESVEEIMLEWQNMAEYEYSNNVRLKRGVSEALDMFKKSGYKLALATASSDKLFIPCLKNNGIYEYFDAYAFGDEVKRSKEYPDIYLLCAERMKLEPESCLVFEDISRGITGAKKAGMKTCGIFDDYSSHDWENVKRTAQYHIMSFEEIL